MKFEDALNLEMGSVVYTLNGKPVTVKNASEMTNSITGKKYVYLTGEHDGNAVGGSHDEFTLKKVEFTAEELQEFTVLNMVSFDLYRVNSKEKGVVPPCWLCMSVEAKDEARKNVLDMMRAKYFFPVNEKTFVNCLPKNWGEHQMALWKEAELTFKQMREDGNPRAFFAE